MFLSITYKAVGRRRYCRRKGEIGEKVKKRQRALMGLFQTAARIMNGGVYCGKSNPGKETGGVLFRTVEKSENQE